MDVATEIVSWTLVLIQGALAVLCFVFRNYGDRPHPRFSMALGSFFFTRLVGRFVTVEMGLMHNPYRLLVDCALLLSLLWLCFEIYHVIVALSREMEKQRTVAAKAEVKAKEYNRATKEYALVLRHRIANPIAIILGMSQTLIDYPDLPKKVWATMVHDIHESACRLSELVLEPSPQDAVEQALRPTPNPGAWDEKT